MKKRLIFGAVPSAEEELRRAISGVKADEAIPAGTSVMTRTWNGRKQKFVMVLTVDVLPNMTGRVEEDSKWDY